MSWIARLTLRQQLGLISALGVLGVVVLGAAHGVQSRVAARLEAERAHAAVLHDTGSRIDRDLLDARRAEKDFVIRRDVRYVARHAQVMTALRRTSEAAEAHARAWPDTEALANDAVAIRRGIERYAEAFETVVASETALGLNETAGL